MKKLTLQEQYNLITKGKGHKDVFLKEAKSMFPQFIRNSAGFDEASLILKQRKIISESTQPKEIVEKDWFKIFESKIVEKNPTKEVVDSETKGYDFKDKTQTDNVYGSGFLTGFYAESNDPKNDKKTPQEIVKLVTKNLAKDKLFYVKKGQFGLKGVGYEVELPGLGTPKEAKGKHKSSGYGTLKENQRSNLTPNEIEVLNKSKKKIKESFEDDDTDNLMFTNGETTVELYKQDGKWHEGSSEGEKLYGWGSKRYMGYLTPSDIMGYLRSDYGGRWRRIMEDEDGLFENLKDPLYWEYRNKYGISPSPEDLKNYKLKNQTSVGPQNNQNANFSLINRLKKEREQIMFDMEQEAELEGGPIADKYGEKLNRIDQKLNLLWENSSDFEKIKIKAQNLSKEEGVVVHVDEISDGKYKISDWYNNDTNVASFENGRKINENKFLKEGRDAVCATCGEHGYDEDLDSECTNCGDYDWEVGNDFEDEYYGDMEDLGENLNNKNKNLKNMKLTSLLSETEYYMSHKKEEKKKVPSKDKKEPNKKSIVSDKIKEIEEQGTVAALEAKMQALDEEIQDREDKLRMVQENEELAEFVNQTRVNEMQKEIKELKKAKDKYQKVYEKKTGDKKKEVIDEDHSDNPNDKYKVKYSKSNKTWQVWEGDHLITDFNSKEDAQKEANKRNISKKPQPTKNIKESSKNTPPSYALPKGSTV